MKRNRGFEVVSYYQNKEINLPKRSTYNSAGYDIEAAETIIVPSYWKQIFKYNLKVLNKANLEDEQEILDYKQILKPTLVPTGLKSYMMEDEYLQIINRSSNPLKKRLVLPNSVGIIDSDYYNNESNEGHIFVQLLNYGLSDLTINKGDRIAQGIFTKFLKVDNDQGGLSERQGGFGSSGE